MLLKSCCIYCWKNSKLAVVTEVVLYLCFVLTLLKMLLLMASHDICSKTISSPVCSVLFIPSLILGLCIFWFLMLVVPRPSFSVAAQSCWEFNLPGVKSGTAVVYPPSEWQRVSLECFLAKDTHSSAELCSFSVPRVQYHENFESVQVPIFILQRGQHRVFICKKYNKMENVPFQ